MKSITRKAIILGFMLGSASSAFPFDWLNLSPWKRNGSNIYYNDGNVGIGTTDPTQKVIVSSGQFRLDGYNSAVTEKLLIDQTSTAISGARRAIDINMSSDPTANTTQTSMGLDIRNETTGFFHAPIVATERNMIGVVAHQSTGTLTNAQNANFTINNATAGVITNGYILDLNIQNFHEGSITNGRAIDINFTNANAAGTLNNARGLNIEFTETAGAISNIRAINIGDVSAIEATGYSMYSAGGINYFEGNVGISTKTPNAKLDVNGGAIVTGDVNAGTFTGDGNALTNISTTSLNASGVASATTFLRGDNTWAAPAGSGDAVLSATQTWSGGNTFNSWSVFSGSVTISNASNTLGGDGSAITNLTPGNISAGAMDTDVIASSVALSGFYDNATVRSNLGLAIGTNVQSWDADLDDLADGSLTGSKVGSGVPAANIANGSLGAGVIASSVAVNGVHTAAVQDNAITDAKVVNALTISGGAVDAADIQAGSLGASVISSSIAVAAVGIPQINASGSPSGATFLAGDGSWAAPAGSGDAVLSATQTWSGGNTFDSWSVFTGSITATNASNTLGGDGASITNLTPGNISAGSLDPDVIASSVALSGFYDNGGVRTNLGLAIGSDVQAYDADLDDLADGSLTGSKVGSGVPAANIAAGSLGASVIASSVAVNAIGSANITDGEIVNADINSSAAIDLSKIAGGTAGANVYDFGGAASLEIPNSAAPTTDAIGEIAVDSNILDHQGLIQYATATAGKMLVVAMPSGDLTTTDGHVVKYDAAGNKFTMGSVAGSGDAVLSATQTWTGGNFFNGSSTTINELIAKGPWVDVRHEDYGVVMGDGTTDNATALQNAMNAATGGVLFIPPGVITIKSKIQPPSNILIRGSGMGISTIKAIATFADTEVIDIVNKTNVTMEHLTIDADNLAQYATQIEESSACVVNATEQTNATAWALVILGNAASANDNILKFNYVHDNGSAGIALFSSASDNQIIGNRVDTSGTYGILVDAGTTGGSNIGCDRNIISGNIIQGPGLAVTIEGSWHNVVSYNVSLTTGGYSYTADYNNDASTSPSVGNLFANNVSSGSLTGIRLSGYENKAIGNTIFAVSTGVYVGDQAGVTKSIYDNSVIGNNISGIANTGVWVERSSSTFISENRITDSGDTGVYYDGLRDGQITSNYITGSGGYAIHITSGTNLKIQNNNLRNNSGGTINDLHGDITTVKLNNDGVVNNVLQETYFQSGNVAIGHNSPSEKLHVVVSDNNGITPAAFFEEIFNTDGGIYITPASDASGGVLSFNGKIDSYDGTGMAGQMDTDHGSRLGGVVGMLNGTTGAGTKFYVGISTGAGANVQVDKMLVVTGAGNVGISTNTPQYNLDVNGTIAGDGNALTNISTTSLNASGTASASTFLRGDNSWAAPAGSGDAVLAATQTWSGGNTFNSWSVFSGSATMTDAGNTIGGDGAALTNLAAANISAGSLGAGVIASSITLSSMYGAPSLTGTNFTSLPGAQVTDGVPAANIAAGSLDTDVIVSSIAVSAVGIPSINASGTPGSGNFLRGDGTWAASGAGDAVLASTQTWSGGNTFNSWGVFSGSVTISNASNTLGGDGAALTNLTAANISAGSLGSTVIASSIAVGGAYPASLANGDYGDWSVTSGVATLDNDVVSAAEMADADHGDVSWSGGVATVDNVAAANVAAGSLGASVIASSVALSGFYDNASVRSNMGLAIGSDVQAYDADLDDLADGSLTGSKVGSGVPAANIASGNLGSSVIASSIAVSAVGVGNLTASGTPGSTTFLRGDNTWNAPTVVSTRTYAWALSNPAVGGVVGPRIPKTQTVKRIDCYVTSATSIDFNIEERSTIGSSGTDLMASDLTATTTGASQTSFSDSSLADGNWLWLDISAVSGTPGQVTITVTYTQTD